MKRKPVSERGQALILIALAIIGLIGITGLAIDGGMAYSDRRHAQNAADTAALAGALAKIQAQAPAPDGPGMTEVDSRVPMREAAILRAESNGYKGATLPGSNPRVEVYTCGEADATCAAPYAGNNEYIQVIITSVVDTFFARIIGVPQVHNRVEAIAKADDDDSDSLFPGTGVMAIDDNCEDDPSETMKITGDVTITLKGGGLWTNANTDCALKCIGTPNVVFDNAEMGTPAEGFNPTAIGSGCAASLSGNTSYEEDPILIPDDIPTPPRPPECDFTNTLNLQQFTPATWSEGGVDYPATRIYPGYYTSFPPTKFRNSSTATENHIVMAPGVYCIDTLLKQVERNVHLLGEDVTMYVLPNRDVKLNGGVIQLSALDGSHSPYPPFGKEHLEYRHYLIIVEPPAPIGDYSSAPSCYVDIEGNSLNSYTGAIFAPSCDVKITGGAGTPPDGINSQIVGFHVELNGTADFTINYDSSLNPYIDAPANTGLAR